MLRCLRDIRCVRYVIIAVFGNVVGSLFLPKPRAKVQQFSHIHKQKEQQINKLLRVILIQLRGKGTAFF